MAQIQAPSSTAIAPPNGNGVVASSSSSSSSSSSKPAIQPSEVGWLFVPQYYTFLNQNPDRLHCFYTKKSTLIHGTEQEDEKPCFGQQEIHNKVVSLGFQDCKVYVSNVDSQSSSSGGIIIQVLGEMSNKSGPWKKFAQTFFLAEQPNGYFVLNDIFRYLKDEDETEEQAEEINDDVRQDEQAARDNNTDVVGAKVDISAIAQPNATPHVQPVITDGAAPDSVAAIGAAPTAAEDESWEKVGSAEVTEEQGASANAPPSASDDAAKAATTQAPAPVVEKTAPAEAAKQETAPAAVAAAAEEKPSAATATAAQAQSAAPAAAPAAAPTPAQPAKPKTWANLAASNATTWGNAVRSDARGVSSNAPPATAAVSTPSTSARPSTTAQQGSRASGKDNTSSSAASVFIKSVQPEHVSESQLRSALSQFGTLKELSLVPNRGCAFAEFTSVDAARKAMSTSASRGGVVVGDKNWKVSVEEKRKPQQQQGEQQQQRGGGGGGPKGGRGGGGSGRGGGKA